MPHPTSPTPARPVPLFTALALVLATPPVGLHAVQLQGVGDPPAPGQRVILVTGSTSGLGREVARALAADGAHVILHGRSEDRAADLLDEIRNAGAGSARFYRADFAALDEVRALAEAVLRDYPRLDALVNNAGVLVVGDPERQLSADGHELHFQVNYLSGYLLTTLLLPRLRESAPARIVNVASVAQSPPDFDDLMLTRAYTTGRAYAQSKLAQILFTLDLAAALRGTGVTVNALHPSTFMDTNMVLGAGLEPRTSVETGRDAVLRLLDDPDPGTGRYFDVFESARAHDAAYDPEVRARLRAVSDALTGVDHRRWGEAH
ncbi:MAG: SDR family NAD(P)-dependent oxidoreductase [Longimicrobiales bacterium]|nr:SDR family NAD(P)-dependent oxidoreductase [Longimicrobiales bacterium]